MIETLKKAPSRLPRPLSHLSDLLNLYGDFITKNASSISQIESALRSLTYIIPGIIISLSLPMTYLSEPVD